MSIYSRRKKAAAKKVPAKKPTYTKAAVNNAYREVQTKMRKEVTKLQKIKGHTPFTIAPRAAGPNRAYSMGIQRIQDIGMKARTARTKAISAAAKKHGVPKSQITAKKPINPGEIASKIARDLKKSHFGL